MLKSKKLRILALSTIATSFFAIQNAEAATYTVQKGDTLSKIAQSHQVTIQDIKKWNNLSKDTIYVAQKLEITKQATAETGKPSKPTTTTPSKPSTAVHTVAKGDTLSKIAKQYNVTIKEIKEWNGIENDTIYIGQVLKISPVAVVPEDDTVHNNVTTDTGTPSKVTTKDPTANGQAIYKKTVEVANTLIGTPYLYGGNTPEGLDCSGFIYYAFNQSGVKIARDSSEGYFNGSTTHVKNPVPGDLVFFENTYKEGISHMGIYLGNNKFIHAGTDGVELSDVTYSYWSTRLVGYKRFDTVK
ncbi:LysM peptidoglycan-binding domain-containing protein [Lysinibacillus sphaericus]|uniref:Cell wall hydrolase phosphatase-associated protein n=2 Tax=Lysinibacillus TaxID=400634 RepID=A0A2S0K4V5_LYSSH|nr:MULTISPECIES: C40 family peptidase [Lysinibacillus]AHN20556.1 peptidase [Lysinibacillus varians]AVK98368.1 peptidase [Lysinibacillus sphaericus]MED4543885.1 LysM peptidoglycan-binding domain-containing protein [Lysinibacillus sphaericus]TKI18493.1 LysM peptidoglycan-binding domain-containing protein [Lysinibacillus sphaericus]TKI51775.1 LysM peptidoglycan-binding domain-containing protein [Lysinibacillus varians]